MSRPSSQPSDGARGSSADLPGSLSRPVDHEIVVKKSRFLAHLAPVPDVAAADAVVARVRKVHWDARHHCVALVVGPHGEAQRSNDDGEPSGTAGVPMLEVLRHRHVTDVVAVVTRYFGGVLLGAGGLVRAYSGAVAAALDTAHERDALVRRTTLTQVSVGVPHADAGRIDHLLRDWAGAHGAVVEPTTYTTDARFTLLVPPGELDRLRDGLAAASAGTLAPVVGTDRVVDIPT